MFAYVLVVSNCKESTKMSMVNVTAQKQQKDTHACTNIRNNHKIVCLVASIFSKKSQHTEIMIH